MDVVGYMRIWGRKRKRGREEDKPFQNSNQVECRGGCLR